MIATQFTWPLVPISLSTVEICSSFPHDLGCEGGGSFYKDYKKSSRA